MSAIGRGRFPASFDGWERERKIDWIATVHTRAGLLASILAHAGLEADPEAIGKDKHLTKPELAAIYLTLEGF